MSDPARIYHNPRCSRSRAALTLLQEAGLEVDIVEYLKRPPPRETLPELVAMLGLEAPTLLRRSEPSIIRYMREREPV
jgi:arsenate reductase (glutaredoxin)